MKHDCTHPQPKVYTHIYIHKHVVATASSADQTTESTETVSSKGSAGTTEPRTSVEITSVETTSEGTFIFQILNNSYILSTIFYVCYCFIQL